MVFCLTGLADQFKFAQEFIKSSNLTLFSSSKFIKTSLALGVSIGFYILFHQEKGFGGL